MVSAADFVGKLDKARKTGRDSWIARCPAHDDGRPSLSIKQADDRVLINCFAGCSPQEICGAVGVDISELMPDRQPEQTYKPIRQVVTPSEALLLIEHEAMIVMLVANDLANGRALTKEDAVRLALANSRISFAVRKANVTP